MIEEVHAILSGWDNVRVEDNGAYWLVAGSYQGQAHAGTRADPISLAHDLAKFGVSPPEPVKVADAYQEHWDTVTSGSLAAAKSAPVFEADPRDAEIEALRRRIAELEAPAGPAEPPPEALEEAYPDEDHAALKARILGEFASLRNMLIGQIPMTQNELARLVALEHPKYQSWLQGVTK